MFSLRLSPFVNRLKGLFVDLAQFDLDESFDLRTEVAVEGRVMRFIENSSTVGGKHFIEFY